MTTTTTTPRPAFLPSGLVNSGRRRYTRAHLEMRIRARWQSICRNAADRGVPAPVVKLARKSLPKGGMHLLGTSSKVKKGSEGFLVAVQYLSGALSHAILCPESTVACRATCLGRKSGRLAHAKVGDAPQAWRTVLLIGGPGFYRELLRLNVRSHVAKARREGLISAIRLDGASDQALAQRFMPMLRTEGVDHLWDYTKRIGHAWNTLPDPHHDVTLSYPGDRFAGGSFDQWAKFVAAGGRLAVVSSEPRPDTWRGFPTVDGDSSDLRFLDPRGTIVWLTVKGDKRNARRAASLGFTVSGSGDWAA